MKLYYQPGACSLSPHIILREAGLDFSVIKVDLKTKKTENGDDFFAINPKGQIPTLLLDNNEILTEGSVIVQYIADQKPDKKLIAPAGTMERYRQLEWLSHISSEIHKGFSPLFFPGTPENYRPVAVNNLLRKFKYIDEVLAKQPYIAGEHFTVADAYLFTLSNWAPLVQLDLSDRVHLKAYQERIAERPNVRDALKAEGLI
ncbi:glutathione transferase GstA [Photorhabdus laumondii subsp. laumondii]|uniref:Glutathione S-transferase n=3 Tax=Enterobacterales TaxID=91347 RepID=Q7N3W8_PHOLL|nr:MULTISPECIES: glutathione transferase GstA [Photorhabdus]AWK42334.1 glutathione S-transferase [Photorhabdus laumondii subsp. laumondii]AXG43178.1 glutathione transferase GstA [Photorhabdus laumondii subsp. laumondii]AXG47649.1 glutathione transferase GstA [Photorhabdus laumondii subsp. laumondii]KTL63005.1 glutathione S-transferase [Photorhabdus laumondii subsp. laumondii]MCC8384179.1 glutathione transferase GstA [Photorhabdus laumondii]